LILFNIDGLLTTVEILFFISFIFIHLLFCKKNIRKEEQNIRVIILILHLYFDMGNKN